MPASPESKTIWPAPAQASRRRSRNRALSPVRPTNSVSPRCAASNRLSAVATPSATKASTGSAKPLAVSRPRPRTREKLAVGAGGGAGGADRPGRRTTRRGGGGVGVPPPPRLLLRRALADQIANDDKPGGNPDADGEPLRSTGLQTRHRRFYLQPGPHRALGVVLMRPRIAEIDQHPIALELGDKAIIARDDTGNGVLIGAELLAQFLGVEPHRQGRRADEIAEHHRQLPPLGGVLRPRTGRCRGRCRCLGGGQTGDGSQETLAVPERHTELLEI